MSSVGDSIEVLASNLVNAIMTLVLLYFAWKCKDISRRLLYIALTLTVLSLVSLVYSIFQKYNAPPPPDPNVRAGNVDEPKKPTVGLGAAYMVLLLLLLFLIVTQLIVLYVVIRSFQCKEVPMPISVLWVLSLLLVLGMYVVVGSRNK